MAQVGFYAYVLGNSTLFSLSKRDQTSDNFRKDLKAVEMYGSSRNLPSELVKKMKSYFEFQAQKANLEEVAVLGKMPAQIFDKVRMGRGAKRASKLIYNVIAKPIPNPIASPLLVALLFADLHAQKRTLHPKLSHLREPTPTIHHRARLLS